MRVLVTGGAGYVGSHCLRALCDAGHETIVFDSLRNGHRAAVDKRAQLVVGDLADAVLLGRPPRISLADSRANTAALLALLRSAREGRPVAVGATD